MRGELNSPGRPGREPPVLGFHCPCLALSAGTQMVATAGQRGEHTALAQPDPRDTLPSQRGAESFSVKPRTGRWTGAPVHSPQEQAGGGGGPLGTKPPVPCTGETWPSEGLSKLSLREPSREASGKLCLHVKTHCPCLWMKFINTKFQREGKTVPITFEVKQCVLSRKKTTTE